MLLVTWENYCSPTEEWACWSAQLAMATTHVVSTALVVEREEEGHALKVQRLVYLISEVLSDSKIRYPRVQMLLYAILMLSASYATTSISRCHILRRDHTCTYMM